MDKTIEIIVVAMVALAIATALLFMVRGQSDSFLGFAQGQQSGAECRLAQAKHDRAEENGNSERANSIESQNRDCSWAAGGGSAEVNCDQVSNPDLYSECSSGSGL